MTQGKSKSKLTQLSFIKSRVSECLYAKWNGWTHTHAESVLFFEMLHLALVLLFQLPQKVNTRLGVASSQTGFEFPNSIVVIWSHSLWKGKKKKLLRRFVFCLICINCKIIDCTKINFNCVLIKKIQMMGL